MWGGEVDNELALTNTRSCAVLAVGEQPTGRWECSPLCVAPAMGTREETKMRGLRSGRDRSKRRRELMWAWLQSQSGEHLHGERMDGTQSKMI